MPNNASADDEECHHRSWWDAVFRRIPHVLIPCCLCCSQSSFFDDDPFSSTTVTGTIICPPNNGKVKMFMQSNDREVSLRMALEFPISTFDFAMMVRNENNWIGFSRHDGDSTWAMSYNGKGVGRALREKEMTDKDAKLLETIGSLTAGVGRLPDGDGEHKYLRGQFERVSFSDGLEAYHLVDPSGCFGQQLSLFFYNY